MVVAAHLCKEEGSSGAGICFHARNANALSIVPAITLLPGPWDFAIRFNANLSRICERTSFLRSDKHPLLR